mmetsp:Transcript_4373/g.4837  ORF Transcript_4373/g.4837 Transcript_4373/m.4837 type:complete len:512 (-) Transcript_4373:288-1823(-)
MENGESRRQVSSSRRRSASSSSNLGDMVEWSTDSDAYTLLGKIGQGAFASVWKARLVVGITTNNTNDDDEKRNNAAAVGTAVAVKVLNLDKVDSNLDEIRKEVQLMRLSLHPNILTCHTAFLSNKDLWVVTPFMDKGSAVQTLQYARRMRKQTLEKHIWYILQETLKGLQYIHDNGQIHRDVKGSNILLAGNGDVKLADFGVSGWLILPQNEKAKTFVGTPCWMAPEVMEQVDGYDYKADIWSLGITALELAKGYAPYAKYPPMKVLILTIQEDAPTLMTYDYEESHDDDELYEDPYVGGEEEIWTQDFHRFLREVLMKNPSKRPTCQELLKSNYFTTQTKRRPNASQELREDVCNIVPDADINNNTSITANNNTTPASVTDHNSTLKTHVSVMVNEVTEDDRPPGTTWVFSDGSQVVYNGDKKETDIEDVMSELDQFCSTTGGENYQQEQSTSLPKNNDDDDVDDDITPKHQHCDHQQKQNNDDGNDDDGLDDFFDEFENNTTGEHFQRN